MNLIFNMMTTNEVTRCNLRLCKVLLTTLGFLLLSIIAKQILNGKIAQYNSYFYVTVLNRLSAKNPLNQSCSNSPVQIQFDRKKLVQTQNLVDIFCVYLLVEHTKISLKFKLCQGRRLRKWRRFYIFLFITTFLNYGDKIRC